VATAAKTKQTNTYASEHRDLIVIAVKPDEQIVGNRMIATNKNAYEQGQVRFKDGFYRTNDPKVIEFLEQRIRDGAEFFKVDEPAPPVSQEEMATLMAAAGDKDALEQILVAESEGHARPEILEAVRTQLGLLG
jgi:hypothetical protein